MEEEEVLIGRKRRGVNVGEGEKKMCPTSNNFFPEK